MMITRFLFALLRHELARNAVPPYERSQEFELLCHSVGENYFVRVCLSRQQRERRPPVI